MNVPRLILCIHSYPAWRNEFQSTFQLTHVFDGYVSLYSWWIPDFQGGSVMISYTFMAIHHIFTLVPHYKQNASPVSSPLYHIHMAKKSIMATCWLYLYSTSWQKNGLNILRSTMLNHLYVCIYIYIDRPNLIGETYFFQLMIKQYI